MAPAMSRGGDQSTALTGKTQGACGKELVGATASYGDVEHDGVLKRQLRELWPQRRGEQRSKLSAMAVGASRSESAMGKVMGMDVVLTGELKEARRGLGAHGGGESTRRSSGGWR